MKNIVSRHLQRTKPALEFLRYTNRIDFAVVTAMSPFDGKAYKAAFYNGIHEWSIAGHQIHCDDTITRYRTLFIRDGKSIAEYKHITCGVWQFKTGSLDSIIDREKLAEAWKRKAARALIKVYLMDILKMKWDHVKAEFELH